MLTLYFAYFLEENIELTLGIELTFVLHCWLIAFIRKTNKQEQNQNQTKKSQNLHKAWYKGTRVLNIYSTCILECKYLWNLAVRPEMGIKLIFIW